MESGSSIHSDVLRRIRLNDQAAWQQVVHKFGPVVFQWCLGSGIAPHDASDIGQNVFEAVSKNLDRFSRTQENETFVGWLRQITRHKIADFQRRQHQTPEGRGGSTFQFLLSSIPDNDSIPIDEPAVNSDSELSPSENAWAIRGTLEVIRQNCHPQTWSAFWETAVKGRPTADVASDLNMSQVAVRQAKSRVLRRLRNALDT